ncbi:phosphotransferase [Desulforegula conservatrix]|uniref:phosphotransferase n=1 Tax=Desulforegula conservatrix TaxID=153026 RepID=UPI00041E132D|nr:phosphotransferase [Desulforegula conservatrix]
MKDTSPVEYILKKIGLSLCDTGSENGINRYLVIHSKGEPRWIIPAKSKGINALCSILNEWRPYSLMALIKWRFLVILYRLNLLQHLPQVKKIGFIYKHDFLRKAFGNSKKELLIYIGTPGYERKAVITVLDSISLKPECIYKIPIEKGANHSIIKEAETLNMLSRYQINAPAVIEFDSINGISSQTYANGYLYKRSLTDKHIDLLIKMPKTGKKISFLEIGHSLRKGLETISLDKKLNRGLSKLTERFSADCHFDSVFVHGDLAPWNIKMQHDNQLCCIDWENANEFGLPLYDLCHFHLMQSFLFGKEWSMIRFLKNNQIIRYLEFHCLNKKQAELLILFYHYDLILKSIIKQDTYASFLISNLRKNSLI